jgi:transcriptional regulator with XRE-family HTH domain
MENYFPKNLKYLRKLNEWEQVDLAKLMNKDYTTIGKWENGSRSPITEDAIRLSEIFNVSIHDLLLTDIKMQAAVKNNKHDEQIKELETKSGIKITYGKKSELTADDVVEITKLVMNELNKDNK